MVRIADITFESNVKVKYIQIRVMDCYTNSSFKFQITDMHHECKDGIENPSQGSPIGVTKLAE